MSLNIFFSVVIPTFNRGTLLKRALQSLSSQTFKNFEVLVIDDGSTDDTEFICNDFKNCFYNFVYTKINNSGGPAKPRNIGINISSGDWICFLDSDDYWYSNKLEICFNSISDDVDVLYHDLALDGIRQKVTGKKLGKNVLKSLLTHGNRIPLSSSIIRKSAIKSIRFNEKKQLSSIEDFHFWLKMSLGTNKFKYLKSILGYYHIDTKTRITQFNEISAHKYLFLKNYLIKNDYCSKSEMFFLNYSIAINLYNSKKVKRSIIYFKYVFYKHPLYLYKIKSLLYIINIHKFK